MSSRRTNLRIDQGFVALVISLLVSSGGTPACSFPDYRFGSGGAGGEAGSSSFAPREECGNGKDDDKDGLVDCDDGDCESSGWRCVTSFSADWHGPAAIWIGAPTDARPTCSSSGGYSVAVYENLKSGPTENLLTCPSCECRGEVSGVEQKVTMHLGTSGDSRCAFVDTEEHCNVPVSEQCGPFTFERAKLQAGGQKCNSVADCPHLIINPHPITVRGGTKEAISVGTESGRDPTHTNVAVVCQLPKAELACAGDDLTCAKRPSLPFAQEICIYSEVANATCPVGWTIAKPMLYQGIEDQRTCSPCTCPCTWSNSSATAKIEDFGPNNLCSSSSLVTTSVNGQPSGAVMYFDSYEPTETRYYRATVTRSGNPSCTASTSETVGKVVGKSPITVCCTGS